MCHLFMLRLCAALASGVTAVVPSSAFSAIIFSTTVNPDLGRIAQNTPGFVVVNVMTSMGSAPAQVDERPLGFPGVQFVGGPGEDDRGDFLANVTLVAGGAPPCFSFIGGTFNGRNTVQPGKSCEFRLRVDTSDPRSPDDTTPGLWAETELVSLFDPNNPADRLTKTVSFNTLVTDPAEPASIAVLGAGLAGLGLAARRRGPR